MFRKLRLKIRSLVRRNDVSEELTLHLDQLTEELRAQGFSPQEARIAAKRQFGNSAQLGERSHDLFSFQPVEDLLRDLRYAWRSIRRSPSVAFAAIISMGLAIGVNTVVFSLIQEIFFSKPTTRAAEDMVAVRLGGNSHTSLANLRDLQAADVFEQTAGFDVEKSVNWRHGEEVRRVAVMFVSENYFDLLEPRPALGRAFNTGEARAELKPHLVVITHRLWTRTFSSDPSVVGRVMTLNGRPYTILGVLPESFRPPTLLNVLPDLYVPASVELMPTLNNRGSNGFMLVARRKPGQSLEQAHAALQVAARRIAEQPPKDESGMARTVRVVPIGTYVQHLDPDAAPLLAFGGVLTLAVFVVLWIACVNVAGVLIARAAARRREIATRLSIGASRGRLVRQLMAESLLLATLGTMAGLSLHWWLTRLLNELVLPLPIPIVFQITADWKLLAYAIALTVVAALLAGLLPALQATRSGLTSGLKLEEPQYGHRRFTLRNALVVLQVSVTVVLLSVALLFTRSLSRVHSIHPGFDLQHTAWASVTVLSDRYPKDGVSAFSARALEAAAAVPGVQSAALALSVPFNGFMRSGTTVQTESGSAVHADYYDNSVSAAYFETMGIPLRAGRSFTSQDRKGSPAVVIINEALARRLFGSETAARKRIWFGDRKEGPGVEVVGVASNSKHMTMGEDQARALYHPIMQRQQTRAQINVLVRAVGDAGSVVAGLRQAMSALDDTAAVDVGSLRSKLAFAYLPSQIGAVLVGSLGALGLALAVIGIYGAMAFAVSRRTAEIGIRLALGASTGQVLRSILGASFGTMLIGLAMGIALAFAAAQPVAAFLAEGVKPSDPVTFASVILICLLAGLMAAIIPARRAMSIQPSITLRMD